MAIVLVIVGLLLGGMLQGQQLIHSARVRQLVTQQEGIKSAFLGFQDRFRALPGDFAGASRSLRCPTTETCPNGNGNGITEESATPIIIGGAASERGESLLVWTHLTAAGFLNGAYALSPGDTVPNDVNSPRNAYNNYLLLSYNADYLDTASAVARHNLKTGPQIPVEIVAEVDRKIDDGNGLRGAFRYSTYRGNSPAAPPAPLPTYEAGQCITIAGVWQVAQGEANCGGASLL